MHCCDIHQPSTIGFSLLASGVSIQKLFLLLVGKICPSISQKLLRVLWDKFSASFIWGRWPLFLLNVASGTRRKQTPKVLFSGISMLVALGRWDKRSCKCLSARLRTFGLFHFLLQVEDDGIEELSSSSQVKILLAYISRNMHFVIFYLCQFRMPLKCRRFMW